MKLKKVSTTYHLNFDTDDGASIKSSPDDQTFSLQTLLENMQGVYAEVCKTQYSAYILLEILLEYDTDYTRDRILDVVRKHLLFLSKTTK